MDKKFDSTPWIYNDNSNVGFQKENPVRYGIYHKEQGKILSFETTRTNGYECCDPFYRLSLNGDTLWLVNDPRHAEYVRLNSTPSYNADYDTPLNPFDEDDLEIVSVKISVENINVSIPLFPELIQKNYADEPKHRDWVLKEYNQSKNKSRFSYSLYDLINFFRMDIEKKKNKKKKK